ncbi:UNKNOWN [Stylonychia lemnae]|uniref:Uncharacterized protein n=1 Tax=Stylonychia lemnae TaxID=5949 RepID=A0A078ACV5_STYLE|nr:UNKNOWN [Stylonychia lemnae]|eukprot:CDW79696.1 UNKNOWN [Stylonychia lemnae]
MRSARSLLSKRQMPIIKLQEERSKQNKLRRMADWLALRKILMRSRDSRRLLTRVKQSKHNKRKQKQQDKEGDLLHEIGSRKTNINTSLQQTANKRQKQGPTLNQSIAQLTQRNKPQKQS